jgi:hypothetical protein
MTIETIKFSEFVSGGDLNPDEVIVGLDATSTINTSFTTFPNLPPGTTADRPAVAATMYFRLRFNTTLLSYEYYSPVFPGWVQLVDSADVVGIIGTANQVLANGTSGSLQTGAVTLTTPQDIAQTSAVQFNSVQFNSDDAILDHNGNKMLTFMVKAAATSWLAVNNSTTNTPAFESDGIAADVDAGLQSKGLGAVRLASASTTFPLRIFTGTAYNHITDFVFANTFIARVVTFPDADGTLCFLSPIADLPTNGFVPIGNGTTFTSAALTAGAGISITNAAGSITIASSTSGMSWSTTAVSVNPAVIDNGYVANSAGALTFTLPATAAVGDVIAVEGLGAGGWIVTANAGQTIKIGSQTTSSGGSLTSDAASDNIYVTCIVANTTWRVRSTNSAGLTIS